MNEIIKQAVKCGPVPQMRDWRNLPDDVEPTQAELVMLFAEQYLKVPDGPKVGQPLSLEPFQQAFLYSVFDNPDHTDLAILSVARRNGKSFITAVILLAYLVGPLAVKNSSIASAAHSRDQAALVFRLMVNMIQQNPDLERAVKIVPSSKHIVGLARNVEYHALSADAKSGYGRSLLVIVLDEAGQFVGETNEYVSMLRTSQGSYNQPLFLTISTQSPSDSDMLSIWIDDSIRSGNKHTVTHLYAADEDADIADEKQWHKANPGLGVFRAMADMRSQIEQASRLPALEAGVRNLLLNQRVALEQLWLAPNVWKENSAQPDLDVFQNASKVILGLDLSQKDDLTAAVLAAKDDYTGKIHLMPFVFIPSQGIEAKAARDRAPYDTWVRNEQMYAIGGATQDYEQIINFLKHKLDDLGITVTTIAFDRWRIKEFKAECERQQAFGYATWEEVGQGFLGFSPRMEAFQTELLNNNICHGAHPLLNMAASNAIRVSDPTGNIKLDKTKASQKIDPMVAAVMAVYPVSSGNLVGDFDIAAMIG